MITTPVDPSLLTIQTPSRERKTSVCLPEMGRNEWYLRQRLMFIEQRLFWFGRINRSDLIDRYGLHASAASKDLTTYQSIAPRNAIYDSSAKAYRVGRQFLAAFGPPSLDSLHAYSVLDDLVPGPSRLFVPLPRPVRQADPAVARNVLAACQNGFGIRILYRSMRAPEGTWRWTYPHAIVSDGQRWHMRAWCEEAGEFRDFVLGRIAETAETRSDRRDPTEDALWQKSVDIEYRPHHFLNDEQAVLVADDYEMVDGVGVVRCREALGWYVLISLGLDKPGAPPRQVIELVDTRLPSLFGMA